MKSSKPPFAAAEVVFQSTCHYHHLPNCHPVPAKIPDYHERVELMTGGRGWIQDGTEWREVLPGDLLWNRPGDFTIGRSDFDNPYRCLVVNLTSKKRRGLGLPRFTRWPEIGEIRNFTEETGRLFRSDAFDRVTLGNYMLNQLWFRIQVHAHRSREDDLPIPLRRALAVIERDYARPCRIEDLARAAEWSPAHLHEVFQERLESSPHQWLIRRRLKAAREKLESSLQPIKQISVECGFADTAAFTHCFKSGVGLTPTEYRKRSLRLIAS